MSITLQPGRRTLLKSLACFAAAAAAPGSLHALAQSGPTGSALPPRRPGELDIHHIDTGRGNCTLLVFPDGTTLMIDAGASTDSSETSAPAHPDASRRPGEWQARYALRHAAKPTLDYFVTTHIHPDHIGDVSPQSPLDPTGTFRLTGLTDVDRLMPISTVIDRAFPSYGATPPPDLPYARNYLAYLQHRVAAGRDVEAARVGSDTQIRTADPRVKVRVLSANARVWNVPPATQPLPAIENIFSVALRLTYGRFSYFSGGDLNFDTHDGRDPQLDIESPVARAAGRTEVAAADHHGYFDACGPEFVRALDAQAYIIQAWDVGHPGPAQMQRMMGAWAPNQATHDVFTTDLLPANQLTNRRFTPQLKSTRGHVVVRVAPGGAAYHIHVLDSSNENDTVTATFGPYTCRT